MRGNSNPPRVERVTLPELSERKIKLRIAAVIALALIAVGALGSILFDALNVEPGWQVVSANGSATGDFVLMYEFGRGENLLSRRLTKAYSEAAETAYRLFNSRESFDGTVNLREIGLHPNEILSVAPELYAAFGRLGAHSSRYIYLEPIYAEYSSLFFSSYDYEAALLDPERSPQQAEFISEVLSFALKPDEIELELLGENRVRLNVSDEYLAFARENGIENLIGLFRLENAFIVDFIAETLISEGFTNGTLTSFDGFERSLGAPLTSRIYDRIGNEIFPAALATFDGGVSVVSFRDFPLSVLDGRYFYEYSDGSFVTPYITADGFDRSSIHVLTAFSADEGCAELALELLPLYTAPAFDESALNGGFVYCDSRTVYSGGSVRLSELYEGYESG